MSRKQIEREVFNGAEAAKYLGVSLMTARKLLAEIPHRRAGRRLLVSKKVLDEWLEGRDAEAA